MNIFVGVMVIIAVGAGIWGWWMENGPEKKDETQKDNIDDKE